MEVAGVYRSVHAKKVVKSLTAQQFWRFTLKAATTLNRAWRSKLKGMARNPFTYDSDASGSQETEFGWGRGRFPDPAIDFSEGGTKSRIPLADPDRSAQLLRLAEVRRMDINDPLDEPSPYVAGNTDRYGAQPPLVRERNAPRQGPRPRYTRPRMERQW